MPGQARHDEYAVLRHHICGFILADDKLRRIPSPTSPSSPAKVTKIGDAPRDISNLKPLAVVCYFSMAHSRRALTTKET
jgi:hypothetical protein